MSRTPLLGVELSDAGAHPAAWRPVAAEPGRSPTPQRWFRLALTAHRRDPDPSGIPSAAAGCRCTAPGRDENPRDRADDVTSGVAR